MIQVRLAAHWRIRRSEWLLSLCTFALGLVYLSVPALFEPRAFGTMLAIMPQRTWGWVVLAVGTVRVLLLMINGAWRASPHGRALCAQISCALWMILFWSAITAEVKVQSVGFWILFFIFDAFSAVDAAGDARMADEKARAQRHPAGLDNAPSV